MGARYPLPDPEYSAAKEQEHLEHVIHNRWPKLEQQRMDFLSVEFDPGNKWWGSMVTND